MTNITLDGLPAKTGTISDAGIIHYREGGVDKKMTVADLLTKISSQYQSFMNTFLGTADKASARAALDIARRTTVSNADYTILVTDKVVAQIGTMSAPRAWSLPTAALYPAGEELICVDQSGTVNYTNNITLSRAGSDTIDGETSMIINQKYGLLVLISDGVSKWKLKNASSPVLSNQFTNKNAVINGDFNVWQRGTSFSSIADGSYHADRWQYNKVGAAVHDIIRSTDVPTLAQAGRLFNYSMLVDCTTADASIAAGDLTYIQTKIEGYNFLPLAQKPITLSFWVKATKIGTYCATISNSGADRSYVAEYTVNTTDTWEYKTITFSASPSAGTWDYINGIGARLIFTLAGGSTYQTTAGSWQTGTYFSTSNQVNATDNTANNFRICGVQLEAGSVATPFEQRTIQQEELLCKRYYDELTAANIFGGMGTSTTNIQFASARFSVPMRIAPSVVLYNTTVANQVRNSGGTGITLNSPSVGASIYGVEYVNVSSGLVNGTWYQCCYKANAEL